MTSWLEPQPTAPTPAPREELLEDEGFASSIADGTPGVPEFIPEGPEVTDDVEIIEVIQSEIETEVETQAEPEPNLKKKLPNRPRRARSPRKTKMASRPVWKKSLKPSSRRSRRSLKPRRSRNR